MSFFLFILFFSIYHLKTFLPPFLQFDSSCIHGWTENVLPLKPGPTSSTRNVFLSFYMCLFSFSLSQCVCVCMCVRNNQPQHLVMGLVKCSFFVCMICHNRSPYFPPPSYVQWMFFLHALRPDLNIKTWACPPMCWIDKTCECLDQHISSVPHPPLCRLLYAMYAVFKCPFSVLRPSAESVSRASCRLQSPLSPFVDNTPRECAVDSGVCSLSTIRTALFFVLFLFFCGAWV